MPAPRPPKHLRPGARPTAHEYNRAMQQVAMSARMNVNGPLTIAHGASGFHFALDTSAMPFLARLTGVYTPTSGADNTVYLYTFVEQIFNTSTGYPEDAAPGRRTIPATGVPVFAYAVEINNLFMVIPTAAPMPDSLAGPYVEMRLRGVFDGVPVYEFDAKQLCVAGQTSGVDTGAPIVPVVRIDADERNILGFQPVTGSATKQYGEVQFIVQDASPTQAGIVNTGEQTFAGSKLFADVTDAASNANVIAAQAVAVGPVVASVTSAEPAPFFAELIGQTLQSDAAPGLNAAPGWNAAAAVLTTYNGSGYGTALWVGDGFISFGEPCSAGNTQNGGQVPGSGISLYQTAGNASYAGASGMDACGNIFLNGLAVVVGNVNDVGDVDGGSYW